MVFGGSFHAGPRPQGGFAVSARLPYEPTTARTGAPADEPAAVERRTGQRQPSVESQP